MQIKTNKSDFLAVLTSASKAVPAKSSFPIMSCVLLESENSLLFATATDGAMTIRAYVPAEGEGTACIDAKMLLDSVSLLPDGDITLTTTDTTATIDYGKGKFTLPVMPAVDFPVIDIPSTQEGVAVQQEALKTALGYVAPSIAKDAMRPQLCGVYFNPVDSGYDLVASDSHTLSLETLPCFGGVGDFILATNAVNFLRSTLKGEDEVVFATDDSKITFAFGNTVLVVTKVVGKFPKYQSVMPSAGGCTLTVPVGDFLSAVKRVATCANKASNSIKFDLDQLVGAVIEAQDLGFGCAAKEEAPYVKYEGEKMTIGFKHDLLTALIAATDADEVTLAIDNPKKAVLITTANENRKAIIMPVAVV